MQDSFDTITIVFFCLAVFVVWRLRSVLGQRTGNERPPHERATPERDKMADVSDNKVVQLPGVANGESASDKPADPDRWKGIAEEGSPVACGLDAIVAAEPTFDVKIFREGAKAAYEMIVTAFAQGDRKTLKGLLSRDVFEGFEQAISAREQKGEVVNTTFVSVNKADILNVDLQKNVAQITVRFASKLITATYDVDGKIIDGAADAVVDVGDTWTFSRTLRGRDPNWLLIATEANS